VFRSAGIVIDQYQSFYVSFQEFTELSTPQHLSIKNLHFQVNSQEYVPSKLESEVDLQLYSQQGLHILMISLDSIKDSEEISYLLGSLPLDIRIVWDLFI